MNKPTFIVHLLSGGFDSVTALHWLHGQGCKIHCCLVDYGQRHVQELGFAKHHAGQLGLLYSTVTVSQLRGSSLTDGKGGMVVPFRNSVLLSHACNLAAVCGAEIVTYACNKDDEKNFPDCRKGFIKAFNKVLEESEINVQVAAPFIDKAKWEIADLARQMGVDVSQTWSCYRGGQEPCGECEACKKREEALAHENVLPDQRKQVV